MRELDLFEEVATGVAARRRKPTYIKLPTHHDEASAGNVRRMVERTADLGLDGVSVSGSRRVAIPRFPDGRGSIAGRPVFGDAVRITADVAGWAAGRLSVRTAGGIFTAADAAAVMEAGADAVEVYSAFVYRGPGVASEINRGLVAELHRRDLDSVSRLRRIPAVA
jgi:dihydroorotate dehydrogenase